jgi:hypothetical protein
MSARQAGPYDNIARKWLALAERRKAHFIDLCNSGRWKHYYLQADLRDEMRRIDLNCDQWARLAGPKPHPDELSG